MPGRRFRTLTTKELTQRLQRLEANYRALEKRLTQKAPEIQTWSTPASVTGKYAVR